MTYKEYLQAKFEQELEKLAQKYRKFRRKLSLKPRRKDFAEEIKTYLCDGLVDLMKEGYSEEEALKITMEKFDEAELNSSFEKFMQEFDGFGVEEYMQLEKR
ncbi:MAG: permease prefix domain 1-containing protein, partial [Desulfotomaculales bacterium]